MTKEQVLFFLGRTRNSLQQPPDHEMMAKIGADYVVRRLAEERYDQAKQEAEAITIAIELVKNIPPHNTYFRDPPKDPAPGGPK